MTQINAPYGLQGVLEYFKQTYGNLPIYVHENGRNQIRFWQKFNPTKVVAHNQIDK